MAVAGARRRRLAREMTDTRTPSEKLRIPRDARIHAELIGGCGKRTPLLLARRDFCAQILAEYASLFRPTALAAVIDSSPMASVDGAALFAVFPSAAADQLFLPALTRIYPAYRP